MLSIQILGSFASCHSVYGKLQKINRSGFKVLCLVSVILLKKQI